MKTLLNILILKIIFGIDLALNIDQTLSNDEKNLLTYWNVRGSYLGKSIGFLPLFNLST